ncbi:MAG: hypothetical protein ACE5GD_04855 [Candidatus Geothermarchaeales archaeon]
MPRIKIQRAGEGILLEIGRRRYAIDKVNEVKADYHIISHAHIDHLPKRLCGKPILSKETAILAKNRGVKGLEKYGEESEDVKLFDSGHILGSRAALIEGEVLYTGDINPRGRLFLKGFRPIKARYLVLEATYGQPTYVFGDFGEMVQGALDYVLATLSMGRRVVLMGYTLGKSQILTELFGWYEKLIIHDSVHKFNRLYKSLGVDLKTDYIVYSEAKREMLGRDAWMLISPPRGFLSSTLSEKYGAVRVAFTGWAAHPSYAFWGRADRGFPLSDHADFQDLTKIVEGVDPEKIFLAYGYTEEFAQHLRNLGYDVQTLKASQRSITEF